MEPEAQSQDAGSMSGVEEAPELTVREPANVSVRQDTKYALTDTWVSLVRFACSVSGVGAYTQT